jgi:hypothetical protein
VFLGQDLTEMKEINEEKQN